MSRIVGIDLGTSTSEISILKDGKPVVLANHIGEQITPSVVGRLEDGSIIVGKDAKDQYLARPQDTVMEIKRAMGKGKTIKFAGESHTPEDLSSEILKYLKICAEEVLGEAIHRAVITVPAYFDDEQRKATVKAGQLAGFEVERIINEPTAAALAYGIEHLEEDAHILVYDLGGGTLDVTLLEMFDGVLEVKASSGNNELGGKDFDECIINYLSESFKEEHGICLLEDLYASSRLKEEAEKCKKMLTQEERYSIKLPFIANKNAEPLALEREITREMFEQLIKEKIYSTKECIDVVIKDSRIAKEEIDLILLVGGSTRIPLVKTFIKEVLNQEAKMLIDPDLAVAKGAAIQAGIINNELSRDTDILITDVCPYTLGIEVMEVLGGMPITDRYSVLIPRNTTIPVTKSNIYATCGDNQEEVEINVFQGDYKKASLNKLLGKFRLMDIPPRRAGEEKIKVEFTYDVNGILRVDAYIVSTNKKASIQIETSSMKTEVQKEEVDSRQWLESPLARNYKRTIRKAEKWLENKDEIDVEVQEELRELVEELKYFILEGDEIQCENYEGDILDLLGTLDEDDYV